MASYNTQGSAPVADSMQTGANAPRDLASIARAAQIARVRARHGFTTVDYQRELRRSMRARAVRRFFLMVFVILILLVAAYVALCSAGLVNALF